MTGPQAVPEPVPASRPLRSVRELVDRTLAAFLADRRAELAAMDPGAAVLVDEMVRLLEAGGKRIRPALCVWAFRAAGGTRDEIAVRAGAALELLHTFALVHDDVMDRTEHRRGVAATHVRFAREAPPGADREAFGAAVAVLVGDLAAVLAERLLGSCGAEGARLARARSRFDRMRTEMAAGQLLDLAGGAPPERVATLKTGSYTAEGPVSIGSALAGAGPALEGPLQVYAGLLGPAFQLRDDVLDRDAPPGAAGQVNEMVARAVRALDAAPLEPEARRALVELARLLELEG